MSEQESTPFDFLWPTSLDGRLVMRTSLCIIALLFFIKGCIDERLVQDYNVHNNDSLETIFNILFFYVVSGVVSWYFVINIGRSVFHLIFCRKTLSEKAEIKSLRRRIEIKKLKKELDDDAE